MLFSKKEFQDIELIQSVEINLGEGISIFSNIKGEIALILSKSTRFKNIWEFFFNQQDSDDFFEQLLDSDEIDIENLYAKSHDKLDYLIRPKGEIKLETDDKTGIYAKGKTEQIYQITSFNPLRFVEKDNRSIQVGLQGEGERQVYATRNIDNTKKGSYTWALKDSKKNSKIIIPQKWRASQFYFNTSVKFKKLIKFHFEEVPKAPKALNTPKVSETTNNEEKRPKPLILYLGILSTLFVGLSKYQEWAIPFFEEYNQAFGYSFILIGVGIASLVYARKSAELAAIGIIAIIYALVGNWLQWPFPFFEDENIFNYKNLIIAGVILIITDFAPKLIGIPLFLLTIFVAYKIYLAGDSNGWENIPIYYWIGLVVFLFISIWLVRKKRV